MRNNRRRPIHPEQALTHSLTSPRPLRADEIPPPIRKKHSHTPRHRWMTLEGYSKVQPPFDDLRGCIEESLELALP